MHRIETAADKRIVDRPDGKQPLAEQRDRQRPAGQNQRPEQQRDERDRQQRLQRGARQLVGGAPATVPPGRSDPRRRGSARAEDVAPAKRGTPRATQHQNARAARWGHTVSRLRLAGATQAPPAGASPAAREGSHRRRCARSATAAPDALEVVRHSRPRPLLTCRSGSGRGAGRGAAARGAGAGSAGLGSAGHLRSHHAANAVSWCHCMERLLRPGADEVVHHERRRVDARASETGQRRSSIERSS